MLTYNQNGTSRGIASIVFSKPDTAAKAAKDLNGLLVDGRPMKVSFSLTNHYSYVWTLTNTRLRLSSTPPTLLRSLPLSLWASALRKCPLPLSCTGES